MAYQITACESSKESPQVKIATNPWPSYELLFVAERQGYFEDEGLNIKLLQLASLVDVQRTFIQGRANAMSSTVIEAIIVSALNNQRVVPVLVPDYSYGGDMIISRQGINSMASLKGKKVGVETGSLGIVILAKALKKYGLTIADIDYINLEQLKMKDELVSGQVDAVVTYPPFATEILRDEAYKTVFTTREIPGQIIDVISVSEEVIKADPNWAKKFNRAWVRALEYLGNNKQSAIRMMADREGITEKEFEAALNDLHLLNASELAEVLQKPSFIENIKSICSILVNLKTINTDCSVIAQNLMPVTSE